MIYSKKDIEETQLEALGALVDGTVLSKSIEKRVGYYCEKMGRGWEYVLSNIVSSIEFTAAFLDLTKCVNNSIVDNIKFHIIEVQKLADESGIPNIFYNEQYVEVLMAALLGHEYNTKTRGADAFDKDKNPIEYKSINGSKGSFQFHWLTKNKLRDYKRIKNIYFSKRKGATILEIWELPMTAIYPYLEVEFKKAETKRGIITTAGFKKEKNTDAHKSFSLSKIKGLGANKVYGI